MSKSAWFALIAFVALTLVGGESMLPVNENAIQRLAHAIARAEGYFVTGSKPKRNNNPGNITDDFGFPTLGKDGMFPIFTTPLDGWDALLHFMRLILSDRSHIYRSDMTIQEMAKHYTTTEQDIWANNVANALGVTVNTPLNQLT